jgi:hypothetical protein
LQFFEYRPASTRRQRTGSRRLPAGAQVIDVFIDPVAALLAEALDALLYLCL